MTPDRPATRLDARPDARPDARSRWRTAIAGTATAMAVAASMAVAVDARAQASGPYVDASAYISGDAQINAWYDMTWQLARDFDWICGDTFCEGEFSNIQALRFACSVHAVSGRIGMCAWSFAASDEHIDPGSGKLAIDIRGWRCLAPLVPGTTLEALLASVEGVSPLYAPLPGTQRSIYDGLVDCL